MIFYSLHGICMFESVVSSSGLCRFALAEIVLKQSAQFVFLDVSAANVLGHMGPAIRVYFCETTVQALRSGVGGATCCQQLCRTAGLVPCQSEPVGWTLLLPEFSHQTYWMARTGYYTQQYVGL